MSPARVSISRKAAQRILADFDSMPFLTGGMQPFVEELRAALKRKPVKEMRRQTIAARVAKFATKREETSAVRVKVMGRADDMCESCGAGTMYGSPTFGFLQSLAELDHFWGRGKAKQSVQNCWALCRTCHRDKTDNKPSRRAWLERFRAHCIRHGYNDDAKRAGRELGSIDDIAAAGALTGAAS